MNSITGMPEPFVLPPTLKANIYIPDLRSQALDFNKGYDPMEQAISSTLDPTQTPAVNGLRPGILPPMETLAQSISPIAPTASPTAASTPVASAPASKP